METVEVQVYTARPPEAVRFHVATRVNLLALFLPRSANQGAARVTSGALALLGQIQGIREVLHIHMIQQDDLDRIPYPRAQSRTGSRDSLRLRPYPRPIRGTAREVAHRLALAAPQ